jgi:hypothetical protein
MGLRLREGFVGVFCCHTSCWFVELEENAAPTRLSLLEGYVSKTWRAIGRGYRCVSRVLNLAFPPGLVNEATRVEYREISV